MSRLSASFLLAIALWLPAGSLAIPRGAAGSESAAATATALESISADRLLEYVSHLAADDYEGREAGTRGGRAAAEHLAERLAELELEGAAEDGNYFQPFAVGYRNVLARIPGRESAADGETIVLCAHYDHIGRGDRHTSLGTIGQIHNGADDNASGVSALLVIAEAFRRLPTPPRRSVVFAFWDAEEKGLLGSKHWVAHPTVPPQQIGALVNLDMIGRLREDRLTLFGTRTAAGFRRLAAMHNRQPDLRIDFSWSLVGNADHYPFVERGIPILFAHTGVHAQYHRETDEAHLIDAEGMSRIVRLVFGMAHELADRPDLAGFRSECRTESAATATAANQEVGAVPLRLGAAWDPQNSEGPGIKLSAITPGSPADKAGIRPGDRLLEVAGRAIVSGEDLSGAVISAPSPVRIVIRPRQAEEQRELTIELAGPPLRLGVTWKTDPCEPGTVILQAVVEGSPAAEAGLMPGDRIYQVAGRDFSDDEQFARRVNRLPGPLELLVEREGRLHTVVVRFSEQILDRAA